MNPNLPATRNGGGILAGAWPAVACLCLAGALVAQAWADEHAPVQDKKDPQSTFEPRSKPGAGQQFLEKLVGEWNVVKTLHPQSGPSIRTDGECRQSMIHQGRFLQSEFVFNRDGGKTSGLGIIGFEPDTGLFTSVWTDSRQTKMSLRQSKDKFTGEEIVLFSKSLKEGGQERLSRTVTRLENDGGKIVHRQFNIGQDGKERLFMELELTHKAAGK